MSNNMTTKRKILTYRSGVLTEKEDIIVTEFPLTIMLNGIEFATMVCTPTHLKEMVIGFLGSEGVIRNYQKDIDSISIDESKGFAYVETTAKITPSIESQTKRFIGSCCGKSRQSFYFQNDVKTAKTATTKQTITYEQCIQLMKAMQSSSDVFEATGGVHNAALCTDEQMVVTRTDIGRHNALDKLYGHCLIEKISVRDKILVFSGRISSEILLKASKIGVGILLSKSAPTELALQAAEELNITTAGFIRGDKMNVYTHPERFTLNN
ncbi:formate dehydrogenase accessory sulfurtransferase FdhD [Alkalihalobacillus sp. AL-G]|uniref:formate dehydrogenase accessory sulfurtransferase FdhD n=1 Tax=Alkalihalobacillus sp. AL-G TaxID=2926399 RepID=UPI00272D4C8C|nr:formate dehydrogenase accessory sulfurtransferase FdhD [Alkalihalobacillus sp. AL-G]WLD92518.1 formate dehydrogenase accessory sulfurtransferase FdhD [Alkalihalobacillus sp. AL-G]